MMNHHLSRNVAALSGFFAVALGAFGAHALHSRFDALGTLSIWQTGVLYQLVHSVVLLTISRWNPFPRFAFWLVFGGVVVFSGSLYLLALTNTRWLGAITPLGGLGMLGGWFALMFNGKRAG
jgi:uncharacterized membrane protein YgdD (TMEM256/DUF423 family)